MILFLLKLGGGGLDGYKLYLRVEYSYLEVVGKHQLYML